MIGISFPPCFLAVVETLLALGLAVLAQIQQNGVKWSSSKQLKSSANRLTFTLCSSVRLSKEEVFLYSCHSKVGETALTTQECVLKRTWAKKRLAEVHS